MSPIRTELGKQFSLALPLCFGFLGHQLMMLVDAALLGHYSQQAMAGAGMGGSIWFAIAAFGVGAVMGLDTLVPQALGAGEPRRARQLFAAGARLCVLLGIPLMLIIAASPVVFGLAGVEDATAAEAEIYIIGRLPALIPTLLFTAQRSFLQAHGNTRPIVIAVVVSNVVNVAADWVFIFGDAGLVEIGLPAIGLPAYGALGAALSTSVVSVVAAVIAGYAVRAHRGGEPRQPSTRADQRSILRLGVPVGAQLAVEVGIFALTAILAGRLGRLPAAAHQVALVLASVSFSVALGVAAATSVRVGHCVGMGDQPGTRRAGGVGMALGAALMGSSGILFILAPEALAGLFSNEAEVIAAAAPLIQIAAVFQLSDAIQAVAAGALRGAGDTRVTFVANLLGHYALGLPIAITLAFYRGAGASGLWWGLSVGLTAVAIGLSLRFFRMASRPIARA